MSRKQARFGQPAVYNTTPPTLSDGDDSALNVDSSGNLKVNVSTGTVTATIPSTTTIGATPLTSISESTFAGTNTTSATVIAANANRRFLSIYNDTTQIMVIRWSASAADSTHMFAKIKPGTLWGLDGLVYTGAITGYFLATDAGNAFVTEGT